jgi:hypothetical protein
MTEGVLAAGVNGESRLETALHRAHEVRQRAVVIHVAVTQDERVRTRGVDLEDRVVVAEVLVGEAEVEQDLASVAAARGIQVIGQAVLREQRAARRQARALHVDGVQPSLLREDVIHVVDDGGEDEPVHDGRS